jgi:hypothetical protein
MNMEKYYKTDETKKLTVQVGPGHFRVFHPPVVVSNISVFEANDALEFDSRDSVACILKRHIIGMSQEKDGR